MPQLIRETTESLDADYVVDFDVDIFLRLHREPQLRWEIEALHLSGLVKLTPRQFIDDRGVFWETWRQCMLDDYTDQPLEFVQENLSISKAGTLRGLHFQRDPHAQGKLVRCAAGRVFDVVVDVRASSSTRGQWFGCELSSEMVVNCGFPRVLPTASWLCVTMPSWNTGARHTTIRNPKGPFDGTIPRSILTGTHPISTCQKAGHCSRPKMPQLRL